MIASKSWSRFLIDLGSVRLEKVEVSLDFICSEVDFKGNQTFELIDWIESIYFFMRRPWKLWQYIKDHTIKNRIYKTLRELENAVCRFVKTLTPEIIGSVCGVSYMEL